MTRLIFTTLISIVIFVLSINTVAAQQNSVQMKLNQTSYQVNQNGTVTVQIQLTASSAKQVNFARAVLRFDPSLVEIQTVQKSTLFCEYPTDPGSYASDNTQGILIVSAISSGTSGCAYPTLNTTPQTMFTVTFRGKTVGTSQLIFEYNGQDSDVHSAVMDTNSPAQFVLADPTDGQIVVAAGTATTTTVAPPDNLGTTEDSIIIITLGTIIVTGILYYKNRTRKDAPRVKVLSR
jgi:hypothetical protein